jgi:DNA topoisomerase VI subunit B
MTRRRVESIPDAVRVTEGLRHTGYTPETAIADLIDNSIAAGATEIGVRLSKGFDNTYTVWIGDNGCGMDEETLIRAMQYGSSRELARNKLSVYGLGMKMASTSFSSRFSVVTREKGGKTYSATYDLVEMKDHPWSFEVGEATEAQVLALN